MSALELVPPAPVVSQEAALQRHCPLCDALDTIRWHCLKAECEWVKCVESLGGCGGFGPLEGMRTKGGEIPDVQFPPDLAAAS
jgi:hypothetical protein